MYNTLSKATLIALLATPLALTGCTETAEVETEATEVDGLVDTGVEGGDSDTMVLDGEPAADSVGAAVDSLGAATGAAVDGAADAVDGAVDTGAEADGAVDVGDNAENQ